MSKGLFSGRSRLALIALLGVLAVYIYSSADEEELLRERMNALAHALSFDEGEESLERLTRAAEAGSFFDDSVAALVRINSGEKRIEFTRKELVQKLVALRSSLAQLAVRLEPDTIEISGDSAVITGTGKAMGRDPGRTDYFLEQHRGRVELVRSGSEWKVKFVENLDLIDTY